MTELTFETLSLTRTHTHTHSRARACSLSLSLALSFSLSLSCSLLFFLFRSIVCCLSIIERTFSCSLWLALSHFLSFSLPKYEAASISRLLNIGLFCKRALQKRRYSAKETYNLKEPTNRSHPIPDCVGRRNRNTDWSSKQEYCLFCKRAL